MAPKIQTVQFFSFGGGLNLSTDPFHVGDAETADCLNVDFDVRGAVKKRSGSIQRGITEPNPPFDLVVPYRTIAGASTLLLVRVGFGVLSMDTAYVTTLIGSSTQTVGPNAAAVAADRAYIVNNADATLKIQGTTATRLGTTLGTTGNHPKAKYIAFHKNRLWFANTDANANPSMVRYSGSDADPNDVEYVKAASSIQFDANDGDVITGIAPFLDNLVVFKRNKIYNLRGNDARSFTKVLAHPTLGCVAPRTIASWDKGVFFLSPRGVFSFDGARVTRISDKIDTALNALPTVNLTNAVGVVFQQRYYLFVSEEQSYNDTCYIYDLVTANWTKYRGWNVFHAATWNRVGADELFGIDDVSNNKIVQYKVDTVHSDMGSNVNAYFTTKWMDFGLPERKKSNRRMYAWFVAGGNYNINVDTQRNYASANVVPKVVNLSPGGMIWGTHNWGQENWGAGVDIVRARISGLGTGSAVRVKVYDTSANPWTLEGLSFVTMPRNFT